MKHSIFTSLLLISATIVSAGSAYAQIGNANLTGNNASLQRSVEYNKKTLSITAPNGEVSYKSLRDLDEGLKKSVEYYRKEDYASAYPIVAELSQWGLKDAQAILGSMYIQGQHVEQSTERGMAWLGVAKEAKTQKAATKTFKMIYKQLNADQKSYIDNMVDGYIAKFGVKAQRFKCSKRTAVGSNIPTRSCKRLPNSNSVLHPIS